MSEILRINFHRDPDFQGGYDNEASCTTPDGVTHSIPPLRHDKRHGQIERVGHMGHGGVIYRLIIKLCDAGWEGHLFEAHDGRIPCLRGVISRKSVPVDYGGEKREQEEAEP